MPEPQEQHYNINKLHIIFTLVSLILLVALIAAFNNDYGREWKKYQKDFRDLEVEKTRVKYDLADNDLQAKSDYQGLFKKQKDVEADLAKKSSDLKNLDGELAAKQTQYDIDNQQYQFARAKYDAARYRYETANDEKSPATAATKKEFDDLEKLLKDLQLKVEKDKAAIAQTQGKIQEINAALKAVQKDEKPFTKQIEIAERKLKKIDPQAMSFSNKIASMVRDLPIVEVANPSFKVQQVVLHDIKDSVNFMEVPKVDRCMTCHLGINNLDYKDAPQPFTTHPNLELFVGPNSAHPMEEFGCTVCHGGRGRATGFTSAVHIPSSDEQAKDWAKKYNWHRDHDWENPMYPAPYVQASCFKCHSGESAIKGAEKLNLGLNLIERAGCYGCHTIDKYKDWPKPGPDLTKIDSKTSPEWAYWWIMDPKSFRHNTWMPAFFNQSNNSSSDDKKRSEQEVLAIVHFLFKKSAPFSMATVPASGNVEKGEEIVASLGCFACHNIEHDKSKEPRTRQSLRREQGPNLIGLGTKTSKQWIYNWLKDPNRYHPETKMPNLRLTDEEASDAAAFLVSDKKEGFLKPVPGVDEKVLNTVVTDFLLKNVSTDEAKAQLAKMSEDDKLNFAGEKLIRHYGCFSCHNITGFENDRPIGTDLTEEGSKAPERLDFGFVPIEHTTDAWFYQKLKDPRIFDHGKVKEPTDKLRMPNFNFTDEEAQAVTTAILGFVKERPEPSKMMPRTTRQLAIEDGQKLIRQLNCQGCHIIEGEGGAIQPTVTQWLVKFKGRADNDAKAVTLNFSPPNLIGEGKKVQTQWLFAFLHQPEIIRPWLSMRMPTYRLDAKQLNTILKYFSAIDNEEFPFSQAGDIKMSPEEFEAAHKLFSDEYFGCGKCHIVGNQMPGGSPDSWAPNFALAKRRLKPAWVIKWLHNPQDLLPGTKMPTYFDPQNFASSGPEDILNGDEEKQIEALRDYLFTLSDAPSAPASETKTPAAASSQNAPAAAAPSQSSTTAPAEKSKESSGKTQSK